MIEVESYVPGMEDALLSARRARGESVTENVRGILAEVRARGDEALRAYAERFDGGAPASLEVSAEAWEAGCAAAPADFAAALARAAENIRAFHKEELRGGFVKNDRPGIVLGQKVVPLARVGLYIPGGTACYPSTVLMNAIPAKLAGVKELIMVTPAKGGVVRPEILLAARLGGVDRIFLTGGAQAVAALAYGTETIPRVDKITGPGNAYVAEAKRQLYGLVGLDMVAGPSEILILADASANPAFVAADMLSQAEHDAMASAVLLTDCEALAVKTREALCAQLAALPRRAIAEASLIQNGRILVTPDMQTALAVADALAPEHLELCVEDPFASLDAVHNAGSIFLGHYAPESLGDYVAGPNHTLPTMGTARFASPLGVEDFVRRCSFTYYSRAAFAADAADVEIIAHAEGLDAHARAASVRREAGV